MKIITKALLLALLALSATAKEEGAVFPSEGDDLEDEIEDFSEDGEIEDFSEDGDHDYLRGRELYPGWCRNNGDCRRGFRW